MDGIQLVYRDVDRTPLLYVIRAMAMQRENLEVDIRKVSDGEDYEQGFLRGEFDLICEHLRFLFPARLAGHPVRCLAACQNRSSQKLLACDGINSLEDLIGKTVAIRAAPSSRISATYWLRHLGLEGRVQTLNIDDAAVGRWQQWRKVASGEASAVVCSPLYQDAALNAGLHDLDAPPLPEIGSIFFAALGPFIDQHEDTLRRFLRALYRAVHTFHHDRKTAMAIVSGEPARLMGLRDLVEIERQYERLRENLDERPIPRLDALTTTYAMLDDGYMPLGGMNPLTLWDLHYVLELDEERFMEQLAGDKE
ncbi:MAG TPA: ABC transporter substrate-binding protein [Dehalococcoidia bacterium]|nr:ABC transporter substrate-binding protein [Dehalococcoidia bacterium]